MGRLRGQTELEPLGKREEVKGPGCADGHVWEAELHPEGSGKPVEGSELGVIRLMGGRSEGNRNRSTETLERGVFITLTS